MTRRLARASIGAAAAAVCFALSSAAHAAVYYQSTFDPFNFSVEAIFEIDAPASSRCLTGPSGWVWANAFASAARPCTVTLVSAVATVVDGTPPETIHIPFVSYTNPNPNPNIIYALYDDDGAPGGIAWLPGLIGPQTTSGNVNDSLNGKWWLQFLNNDAGVLPSGPPPHNSTAYLYHGEQCFTFLGFRKCIPQRVPGSSGIATIVNDVYTSGFRTLGSQRPTLAANGTPVPEPGSLALVLGALGAGWLALRRKATA
jgi:hypothetical protein